MAKNLIYCPKCGKPAESRPWTSFSEYGGKYENLTCRSCGFDFNIYAYKLRVVFDAQGKQLAVFADNEGL